MKIEFSKNLKKIRKENNLTQDDLASYLGLERQTVSSYETGKREPSLDTLVKISDLFKVPLDTLILGKYQKGEPVGLQQIKQDKNSFWMSYKEMNGLYHLENIKDSYEDIIGLDEMTGRIICKNYTNTLLLGPPGSGKTVCYTLNKIGQVIRNNESTIITDFQGHIFGMTYELFKKHDYKIKVFNMADPEHSNAWNIFSELRKYPNEREDAVSLFADMVVGRKNGDKGSLYYDYACKNLLMALCLFVLNSKDNDMDSLMKILDYDNKTLFSMFDRLPYNHPSLKYWNTYMVDEADNSDETIKNMLKNKLNVFQSASFKDIIRRDDIDTELPGKEKCAYYIIMPSWKDTYGFAGSMLLNFCIRNIINSAACNRETQGKCKIRVNFILDEFQNIDRLKDFHMLMIESFKRNVNFYITVQRIEQLQMIYQDNWENIIDCCSVVINMSSMAYNDHKILWEKSGYIMPDKLETAYNQAIVYDLGGRKPLIVKKYGYYDNPFFKNVLKADITYYGAR